MGKTVTKTSANTSQSDNLDLYKNQLNYEKFVDKKMTLYKVFLLISSIMSLVSMIVMPMFGYRVNRNVNKHQDEIWGDYNLIYMLQKFLKHEFGKNSLYTVGMFVFLCATLVLSVFLIVSVVLNYFTKISKMPKILNKDFIIVFSSIMIVCEFAALLCCRISVNGAAENLYGFWIMIVAAIVMVCTSIPLSTYRKNYK